MSHEIEADRNQTFLLPPALDDWVPEDHPARFIAAFVDSLDLQGMGFEVGHTPTGRPRYSARLLLSVICYCYFSRIRSLRGMEQACLENVAVMWLTGLERPDHNTLWRFWRDNRDQLRGLLKQSVRVAADMGLVGMVLNAVDGTKIQAQASLRTAKYRNLLKAALERIEDSIGEMERGLQASAGDELEGYRLPEGLADARARKERIERSLKELDEAGANSLNPHEPDARVMKCGEKKTFGYNAQAVSDERVGIVVGADVVAEETDHGLLADMIEKAEETAGQAAKETLADKGYSAAEDIGQAQEKGYEVLVNLPKNVAPPDGEDPFHSSRFTYDSKHDCCICPIGGILKYQRTYKDRGKTVRVYHCTGYKDCLLRETCSSNTRGRTIKIGEHHQAVERQRQKQRASGSKALLARRAVIIEPVFAMIKDNLGFRRWSVRNLEGVKTQWALTCATVNLRKLYHAWADHLPVYA